MNELMELAYKEALKAYKKNEIPVGAIITYKNKVIAKGYNNRQKKHNALGHAEIVCIQKAEKKLKDWRLNGCNMYVTLMPCEMCKIIIRESRINNVYYLINKPNSQTVCKKVNSNYIQTSVSKEADKKYKLMLSKFFENMRNKL